MPERPEVALAVGCAAKLHHWRIKGAYVARHLRKRGDRDTDVKVKRLRGQYVRHARQRGKYILLFLASTPDGKSDRSCLVIHLGMSGMLSTEPDHWDNKHVHMVLHVALPKLVKDGPKRISPADWNNPDKQLLFCDPRKFGRVWHCHTNAQLRARFNNTGPDVLRIAGVTNQHGFSMFSEDAGADRFARLLRKRFGHGSDVTLYDALMHQGAVSGYGNIYTAECLHRAGLKPTRKLIDTADAWLRLLYRETAKLMMDSFFAGGSTVHSFRGPDGKPGEAQKLHKVYGKDKCGTCGAGIVTLRVRDRKTYYCLACQR